MKKLFFLLFVFYSFSIFAQQWCTPGAQWHYGYGWFSSVGYVDLKYMSDTTYAGQPCHKLTEHLHVVDQFTWNDWDNYTNYYSYESNGIVFAYDSYNLIWDTLFDFNSVPGERWHLYLGNDSDYVEVQDTGTNILQGINLKWLTVKYNPNLLFNFSDTIYERIGCVGINYPFASSVLSTDPGYMGFCNYSDSNFIDYYSPDVNCEELPDGFSEQTKDKLVIVYPNPTNGKIFLKYIEEIPLAFDVLDICGRPCRVKNVLYNNIISLEELDEGIYFLKFYFKDHTIVNKIELIK